MALGYGNLLGITWVQGRIPPELMGRVMSLLITGSVGLVPVSMFIAGVAVQFSVDATMLVAGAAWPCCRAARCSCRRSGTSAWSRPIRHPGCPAAKLAPRERQRSRHELDLPAASRNLAAGGHRSGPGLTARRIVEHRDADTALARDLDGPLVAGVRVAEDAHARVGRQHALSFCAARSVPSATTTMPACWL